MNTINKSDFYYLSLSDKQLDFLADTSGGINRMRCFLSLLRHTAMEQTDFTCRGITRTTHTGECNVSVSQLAKEWDCNRKTAIRFIKQLVLLGIVTTASDNLTTTVSMRRLAGWQNGHPCARVLMLANIEFANIKKNIIREVIIPHIAAACRPRQCGAVHSHKPVGLLAVWQPL